MGGRGADGWQPVQQVGGLFFGRGRGGDGWQPVQQVRGMDLEGGLVHSWQHFQQVGAE